MFDDTDVLPQVRIIVITPEYTNEFFGDASSQVATTDGMLELTVNHKDGEPQTMKLYAAGEWNTVEVQVIE